MRLAIFIAFIIVSGNASAQLPPARPVPPPQVKQAPQMAPPRAVPPAPPVAPVQNNEALTELLRAQTAAIKSLSNKLDSLEERIGKIEKGGHQ